MSAAGNGQNVSPLAPVCDVDPEEVLRLDREATPGPWEVEMRCARYISDPNTVVEVPGGIIAREIEHTVLEHDFDGASENAALIATYRTAAPALAREVIRLRAEVARFVDEQRRDLKDVEHFRQLARGYMDERDELRLTIAAEQGRPEGAPSEGWTFDDGVWIKGDVEVRCERAEDGTFGWVARRYHPRRGRLDKRLCEATTARAAMIAADAAVRS